MTAMDYGLRVKQIEENKPRVYKDVIWLKETDNPTLSFYRRISHFSRVTLIFLL